MADYEFYPVGVSSSEAAAAIRAASGMAKTAGLIRSNGTGEVAAAQAGIDYGYPVLLGDGPPTQFVAGELGQFYYNRAAASAPYMYVCVDYTSQGYQWQVLGAGGSGFVILGYYDTLELMQSSVTNPQPGDAYGVGTAEPYTIYVFDGITHTWKSNGTLGVGGVTNGIPPHGATGQVLVKRSAASGDTEWATIQTVPLDGSITGAKIADRAVQTRHLDGMSVTLDKLAAGVRNLQYTDLVITPGQWTADSTYANYPYRASIPLETANVDHTVSVVFDPDSDLSVLCPVAEAVAGAVYVYAAEALTDNLTILNVTLIPNFKNGTGVIDPEQGLTAGMITDALGYRPLGVPRKIADITLTEDGAVNITADMEGNSLALSGLMLKMIRPVDGPTSYPLIAIRYYYDQWSWVLGEFPAIEITNDVECSGVNLISHGTILKTLSIDASYNQGLYTLRGNLMAEKIVRIYIPSIIPAGTRIIVMGG